MFVLGLAGSVCPRGGQAQDASQTAKIAEGNILHRPTKSVYHYRIDRDSTIHLRKGLPSSDSVVAIPATTLASIYRRVEKHLLSSDWLGEQVVVGYEGNNLVLRFTQRFNLYVLGTLIVVIVVGGSLLGWLWRRLSTERHRREALAQSRRYLAEGREKERERLAQEIHDGPVQELHGLHMQLKALSGSSGGEGLEGLGDELMRVTGELRAMSADLHPPALQRFGLAAALRSHADRLRDRHPSLRIDVDLTEECALDDQPDEYVLAVFRIAQESMNNAAQHGQADRIQVRLRCPDRRLTLEVRDDGAGFSLPDDWHALAERDHYGLLGMRERAEAIGAELEIDSSPGDGTRVRLRGHIGTPEAAGARDEPAAPVPA